MSKLLISKFKNDKKPYLGRINELRNNCYELWEKYNI